jgi:hypothetical protein
MTNNTARRADKLTCRSADIFVIGPIIRDKETVTGAKASKHSVASGLARDRSSPSLTTPTGAAIRNSPREDIFNWKKL